MKLIDTHAHLLSEYYKDKLEEEISNSLSKLEYVLNIACDIDSSKEVISLHGKHPNLLPVVGIHPFDIKVLNEKSKKEFESILLINKDKIKAIGEIGLDYSRKPDLIEKQKQMEAFIYQVELACKYDFPVVVHSRDAYKDCFEVIKNYPKLNFLIHSWTGNKEELGLFLKLKNVIFSFNGIITFTNADELKEIATLVPIEKIVLETDCPYLTPVPFRGKTNYPYYLEYIALELSKIKNISLEKISKVTNKNAKEFYNIK